MPPAPCASPSHSPVANKKMGGGSHGTAVPSTPASSAATSTTADDMTIKTDDTTAVVDNTTTITSSNNDGEQNKDEISASTRERARSHWSFIKSLHKTQKQQLFKMGSNSSLTTAEATFLNMITKSQLDVDHKRSLGKSRTGAAAAAVASSMDGELGNSANERSVSEPVVSSIGITDDDFDEGNNTLTNSGPKDDLAISGRTHFSHLVQAAVAKENLRKAISARLTSLNGAEAKFLTKLVTNKSVSLEALNNALHVLDNDPLYNKELRKVDDYDDDDEEEDEIEYPEHGADAENNEDGYIGEIAEDGGDEGGSKGNINRRYSRGSSRGSGPSHRRRESAIKSTMLFDKILDDSLTRMRLGSTDSAGNKLLDGSVRDRRKSTKNERSVWEMATINREELASMSTSPTSGGSLSQSERMPRTNRRARLRNRKDSVHEKSLWNLVHAEETEEEDEEGEKQQERQPDNYPLPLSKSLSIHSVSEDEDGLPIKATKAGDAIDPLLMAAPVEKTPMVTNRKALPSVESLMDERSSTESTPATAGDVKIGLDELLTTLQPQVEAPHPPPMDRGKSEKRVGEEEAAPPTAMESSIAADESVEVTPNILVCCGMEGMSLLDDMMGENSSDKENANIENAVEHSEEDSLASKKRYLHLEPTEVVENEQRVRLSTWIGKPEDYPILGLGKKRKSAEEKADRSVLKLGTVDMNGSTESDNVVVEDGVDPLEPHVLSPLLMKCLRDHLPFALREENFWLKYSLARDGASLEVIFLTMRHSQHTILAIETTQGEVFGSFTSSPWRSNGNEYYGSCEAFVWMLRKTRRDPVTGEENCGSLDEYILRESSLDVFQWNHGARGSGMGNRNIQLSNTDKLFVGGGYPDDEDEDVMKSSSNIGGEGKGDIDEDDQSASDIEWGMALALDKDLLFGTSSRCATFASNPLIDGSRHEGSEVFEIMNIEIWALTPCMNEEMAEELELGRTFVMGFHKQS